MLVGELLAKAVISVSKMQLGILLWTDYIDYPESVSIILILLTGLFVLQLSPVENINRPVDIEEQ